MNNLGMGFLHIFSSSYKNMSCCSSHPQHHGNIDGLLATGISNDIFWIHLLLHRTSRYNGCFLHMPLLFHIQSSKKYLPGSILPCNMDGLLLECILSNLCFCFNPSIVTSSPTSRGYVSLPYPPHKTPAHYYNIPSVVQEKYLLQNVTSYKKNVLQKKHAKINVSHLICKDTNLT